MAKQKKKPAGNWAACKAAMRDLKPTELMALMHEVYELSAENRLFVEARLLPEGTEQTLEEVKRKLGKLLSVQSVFADRFRHADVKRMINQFAKATGDAAAVADLLVTDLEIGFATFSEIGDDEQMVDHLFSMLARLEKVLATLPPARLGPLIPRINELSSDWGSSFGYGISDELNDFASTWNERYESRKGESGLSA